MRQYKNCQVPCDFIFSFDRDYPRIQIVTIQEIIEGGARLDLPLQRDVLKKADQAAAGKQTPLGLG